MLIFLLIGIIGIGMCIWIFVFKNLAIEREFKSLTPLYSNGINEINELYEKLQNNLRCSLCTLNIVNTNTIAFVLPDGTFIIKFEGNGISFKPVNMPIGFNKQIDFYFRGIIIYYAIQKVLFPNSPIDSGDYTNKYSVWLLMKKTSIILMISGIGFFLGIFAVKNFVPLEYKYEVKGQVDENLNISNGNGKKINEKENISESNIDQEDFENNGSAISETQEVLETSDNIDLNKWVGNYECYYGEYSSTMTILSDNGEIGVVIYQEYPVFEEDTEDYYFASGEIVSEFNSVENDGVTWIYDTNDDFILFLKLNDDGSIDVTHEGENLAQFGNEYIVFDGTYYKN